MLIRFSVENFKSFNEKQIFSMAAGKHTRHQNQLVVTEGKRLLKAGLIFGANASGKSNFIKAIEFGKNIIIDGLDDVSTDNCHYRIDSKAINRPAVFQYDFVINGHFYSYGFAISYTKKIFEAEWLYLCDNDKEFCIFERVLNEGVSTNLKFTNILDKQRFDIYASDINDKTSFLSDISSRKLEDNQMFKHFFNAYIWLKSLIIIFPNRKLLDYGRFFKNDKTNSLNTLLKYFDTGIETIVEEEATIEKVLEFLPEEIKNDIIRDVQKRFNREGKVPDRIGITISGKRFYFSKKNDDAIVVSKLRMDHGNPLDLFDLDDESDGTKRLFDLIPLYQAGIDNSVILVDELDRSFHTKLTMEFIKKFIEKTEKKSSQLILTLHDTNIMNLDYFRQDEIWFVERKSNHSSEIYSLNKFKERFDKKVAKDYLLGRFGSIPNFEFDDLE